MKKTGFTLFLVVFAFCSFIFSCTKPSCPGTICYNGGVKEGGGTKCNCICPYGYAGSNCDTEARQAFIGTYSAQCYDNNGFGCGSFIMPVSANTDSITGLTIGLNGVTLSGILDLYNSNVVISSQTVAGVTYVGAGIFQSGTIVLTINSQSGNAASTTYYQGPKQ